MNLDEFTFLANTFKFVVCLHITAVLKTVKGKLAVLHLREILLKEFITDRKEKRPSIWRESNP